MNSDSRKYKFLTYSKDQTHEVATVHPTATSWLFIFRAITITLVFLAFLAIQLYEGLGLSEQKTLWIFGACVYGYFSILISAIIVHRSNNKNAPSPKLAHFQLFSDVLITTVFVVCSGGIESAFSFLYALTVINAALVFSRKEAIFFATLSLIAYVLILSGHLTNINQILDLPILPSNKIFQAFFAQTLALYLIAYLSSSLSQKLKQTRYELSKTKDQLIEVQRIHESILESIPSGVMTLDKNNKVIFINSAGSHILMKEKYDLLQKNIQEVGAFFPKQMLKERFECQYEVGNESRTIGGNIAKLKNNPFFSGQVIVFQDLTEIRILQKQLQQVDRLRSMGRFSAGLAHEMRNPLASMSGCIQLLSKDMLQQDLPINEDTKSMLDILDRETNRLTQLLNDFLLYARPAPPNKEVFDYIELVKEIIETEKQDTSTTHIPSQILFQKENSYSVTADRNQVKQVIWNIYSNALNALREDVSNAQKHLQFRFQERKNVIVMELHDNGPGISEEDELKIFVPFYTTRAKGTGLGLPTAHQLAVSQNGSLEVIKSVLAGAAFRITLPKSNV